VLRGETGKDFMRIFYGAYVYTPVLKKGGLGIAGVGIILYVRDYPVLVECSGNTILAISLSVRSRILIIRYRGPKIHVSIFDAWTIYEISFNLVLSYVNVVIDICDSVN
jgi:hypothetical protein